MFFEFFFLISFFRSVLSEGNEMKMSASLPVFNVPHLVQIGSGAASSSSINKIKHTFTESNFSPTTLQVVFKRCSRTTLYTRIQSFKQFSSF